MMRKYSYYILMISLLLCQIAVAAPAQSKSSKGGKSSSGKVWKGATRNIHHIGIWGGGGYSGLMNSYENNKFIGGGGGLLGMGYEYRYDNFILDAGAEFRLFSSADRISFPLPYDVMTMADGYNQTKHYTFADPMKENHLVGQVMVPIMAGGRWEKWYFLAGAKVGYTVMGNYAQDGSYSTSITDYMAQDPNWINMPSHGVMNDIPYTAKGKTSYGLDVTASAEVGLNINGLLGKEWNDKNGARKHPVHMRAAVFADYGVLSIGQAVQGPMVMADEAGVSTRSLHVSDWATGRLNSLMVGVKFTAWLQLNKPQPPKPAKPAMVLFVTDEQTDKAIAGATVEMTPTGVKKARATRRATNSKGVMVVKVAAGPYDLRLTHPDYESKEHSYEHGEWGDTLSLSMKPRQDFRLYVRDAKSDSLLAATVKFVNTNDKKTIATVRTDSITGFASLHLPAGIPIRINIKATNYMALTEAVEDISGEKTYRLEPIVKKRVIVLHNLFFATNKTTILPESEEALQDLYTLMAENPEIRIRITGHTDNIGSDRANQVLSEGRANSVRDELIRRGIAADRIEAEGKGESEPIATNDTEEGRAQNRRVELTIL